MHNNIKRDIINEYVKKYPNANKKSLARKIYEENKALFDDIEKMLKSIHYYTGKNGKSSKKYVDELKEYVDPALPKPLTTIRDYKPFSINGNNRILIMSDIHIPFYSRDAVEITVKYALKYNPDIVILNGDIIDFYAISYWTVDPRLRNFKKEIDDIRMFLAWLKEKFPKSKIIFKHGNHEERYEYYMIRRAPELIDVDNFSINKILEFDKLNIKEIKDRIPIKINELYLLHGHEYGGGVTNPVNPARGLYLRAKCNAAQGHYHQSSSHSEPDISNKITACWSFGHLSDPHPRYRPLNKWNHGFAIIETEGYKRFNVNAFKIFDKEVYSE